MIREILLRVPTSPDAAPEEFLESAVALCQHLGASLTASVLQLNSDQATWPLVAGSFPLDFPQLMNELVVKSEANAAASASSLSQLCAEYGVTLDLRRGVTTPYASQAPLVDLARLHDLAILPVPESEAPVDSWIPSILFGSGRPIMLLPSRRKTTQRLDRVVVAWDWSREAARALAAALPLIALAKSVHIVTVFGEKHIQTTCTPADLEKYLVAHHVKYDLEQVELKGKSIGEALTDHAESVNADLLVMGAYGHSRIQEFVLGGATREVLRDPPLPVLLCH
jgi:nucleotide-binding universal stress UspA family protein